MTSREEKLPNAIRPYSQSPWPAWSLASLFLASSALPPRSFANLPPFPQRVGFSMIMFGAGYALQTGDSLNGSGISTGTKCSVFSQTKRPLRTFVSSAWPLIYLFWNGRRSLTAPRNPISVFLTGATAVCAGLYGTEYFILQGSNENPQQVN
ncbi:hypothetical protein DFH11DRAFT_1238807 [Phellopilus nigrolimitatus]|nr:hypothetical protein DFH11DRAFT_1238807 [Phellopilus nigrolimitatus]